MGAILGLLPLISARSAPVINEVHHGPEDKTTQSEFVEIFNPDAVAVDLSDWSLTGGISAVFPPGTTIGAGDYLLVAENATALASEYSLPSVTVLEFGGFLNSDGETIRLRNELESVVDRVEYRSNFPWPVPAAGDGPSMELKNPSLDNDLGGSWASSAGPPTPGAQNSIFSLTAAPQMRQVEHLPEIPTSGDEIVVRIKATDPDGIASMTLEYQLVAPGAFVPAYLPLAHSTLINSPSTPQSPNPGYFDAVNWTSVAMAADPETDFFTATIPAQPNRTLVRYRVVAEDGGGASQQAPSTDDPSLNFAAFVYNGVPDFVASENSVHPDGPGKVYPKEMLTQLPVHTIVTRNQDLLECYAYSANGQGGFQIAKGNRSARRVFNWECAFVYDGIVYDHVKYRLRQNNNRYAENGKRSMRFRFMNGKFFQARDEEGKEWPVKWKTLSTGKMSSFTSATTYGMREVTNSKLWRMVGSECPFFYHMHFRVIDGVDEAPAGTNGQYMGDFFGLGMAFEDIDGRLLEARNLPDGNIYKWKDGETIALEMKENQERFSVTNGSDFTTYRAGLNSGLSEATLETMVDWEQWSLYHTVCEAIRHYDFGTRSSHHKNMAWYFQPDGVTTYGKLRLIPHDHDASWGRGYHDNLTFAIGRDFPWRSIFKQATNVGDPDDRDDLKPGLNRLYRNVMRNYRDLFWQEETVHPLIDDLAESIEEFSFADRDRWLGGPTAAGEENAMGEVSSIVSPMKQIAFVEDFVDGSSLSGGRAALLDQLTDDPSIPDTPVITYSGDASFTPGLQVFDSSSFSDPQGIGSFAAMEWRIAEVDPSAGPEIQILSSGEDWKYFDLGTDLGAAWREESYDDSSWASGPSQLGYTEGDEATLVSFGTDVNNKHITTYFRRTFDFTPGSDDSVVRIRLLRDDGAAVYLNGSEIARPGLPSGTITFGTTATENAPENIWNEIILSGGDFNAGSNTLAVEIHQRNSSSSDISFDLEMFEGAAVMLDEGGRNYEWFPSWESGEQTVFTGSIMPPAAATREDGRYRARVRHKDSTGNWSNWSDPVEFTAGAVDVTAYTAGLVISEFMADPPSATIAEEALGYSTADFEYLMLTNTSRVELDMANVRFTKGIDYDFSGSLAVGESVVLARNPAAYSSRNGGSVAIGPYAAKLNNEGERLKLSFGAGESIRDFEYDNLAPWPTVSDGSPYALRLIAPDTNPDHANPASWMAVQGGVTMGFSGDPDEDDDRDDLAAAIEHALGSDRNAFTPNPLTISLSDGTLSFVRDPLATGVQLVPQVSGDLIEWEDLNNTGDLLESVLTPGSGWLTRYRLQTGNPDGQYFRLRSIGP